MKVFLKFLHIKNIIIIIILGIVYTLNITAQNNYTQTYNSLNYKFPIQNLDSKIVLPTIHNIQYRNLQDFVIFRDSLQLNSFTFSLGNISEFNYTQPKLFNFSFENTDTLRSCFMYKQAYKLTPPNINFHYIPSPTTWQSLGVLFMGITRTVLFPTAPDYRIE